MGRLCKICTHDNRLEIDKEIIRGAMLTELARRYDVPYSSIVHHKDHHLSRQLITSHKTKNFIHAESLMAEIQAILDKLQTLMKKAEDQNKLGTAISGIREWRSTLEFTTNLAVKLKELEMQEKKENEPLKIKVTIVDDGDDFSSHPRTNRRLNSPQVLDVPVRKRQKKVIEIDEFIEDSINPALEPDDIESVDLQADDDDSDFKNIPGYYEGVDCEGLTFEDRMKPRSRRETAGVTRRDMAKARRKRRPRHQFSDMVVPGSVRTSRNIGL